jgi:D-alanine-D-alanine ligase
VAVTVEERLVALERALVERARDLALFLVYDRPGRASERPGLDRTFFAQRCVSDEQLTQTIEAFRDVGAYVELFEGERPLLEALAEGRLQQLPRDIKLVYNGIEGGIAFDGFAPGRKALIPSVADSYGILCANSNAYACALGRHKFHYFTVLRALGLRTPRVWHRRLHGGWAGDAVPPAGTKVIAKSTFESWSVGVTEDSIFVVDETLEERVGRIADAIGQAVTVQEFVSGTEVCVPVLACPELLVTPPVEAVLAKAPGDTDAVMTIEDNLQYLGVTYRPFDAALPVLEELAAMSVAAFTSLELEAFARIDFRVDESGRPWVIDIGVSPGLSRGSSSFHSLGLVGFDHASFLRVVVAATLAAHSELPQFSRQNSTSGILNPRP